MSFIPGMGNVLGNGQIMFGANTSSLRGDVRKGMDAMNSEVNKGLKNVSASQARWNAAFGAMGMAAKAGVAGVVAAMGMAIGASIQFESSWAGVRKTLDATPEQLAELRQQFRDLAKEIPVSVNELAKIGETAGALGIAREDVLEFTKTIALIGQTTNVTTEEASTALGQLSNVLKLSGKDYGKFADTLVDLGNKGASTESQILAIASRAGSAAGLIGMATPQMLAFASATASLGIEVEAGGSSLQNFFLKMNKYVGKGGKELKIIASIAGTSMKEFAAAFKRDPAWAMQAFLDGLGKSSGSTQQLALELLKMNDIRITRMLLGLANGGDILAYNLNNAAAAWTANSAATEEFGKRAETTASQMGLIKNIIHDYLITLGDSLLPMFKIVVDTLKNSLPKAIEFLAGIWNTILMPPLLKAKDAFLGLGEALANVFGDRDKPADWGNVVSTAISGVASAVGHLVDMVTPLINLLKGIVENPIGQWAIKGVVYLTALRIAVGLFNQTLGRTRSLGKMLGGGLFGGAKALLPFGLGNKLGGGSAIDPDQIAANKQVLAAEMQLKAAQMAMAETNWMGRTGKNWGGPIQYKGTPGLSTSMSGSMAARQRAAYGAMPAAQAMTWAQLAQPMMDPKKPGGIGSAIKGALGGVAGLVSKVFWPVLIATFAAEIIKAPVGDFIAGNTKFKRAGAMIKEDFFGGMIALFQSALIGSDTWVGRAEETKIGNASFSTMNLSKLGITNATFDKLEAPVGTILHMQGVDETVPVVNELGQKMGEDVITWYKRIAVQLATTVGGSNVKEEIAGLLSRDIADNAPDPATIAAMAMAGKTPDYTPSAATQAKIAALLSPFAGSQITELGRTVEEGWSAAVADALTAHGLTVGQQAELTTAQKRRIGDVVELDAGGKYDWMTDLMIQSFTSGVTLKTGKQVALSADAKKAIAALKNPKKGFGADWEKEVMGLRIGTPKGKANVALAKKLEATLGADWQETLKQVYRELHPARPTYALSPLDDRAANIKAQKKRVETAMLDYIQNVPKDVSDQITSKISQMPAALRGEMDPDTAAALRKEAEKQWLTERDAGLRKFASLKAGVSAPIAKSLTAKYGADWEVAFRSGVGGVLNSKTDKDGKIRKEMARAFGPKWESMLQGVGAMVFAKKGGADFATLQKMLAAEIKKSIAGLTPADLDDGKGKKPTKVQVTRTKERITKILGTDAAKAALEAATSDDTTKAAAGFKTLGDKLAKAIPDEKARTKFISSLVALQDAATSPNLDGLTSVLSKGIPTAAGAIGQLNSGLGTLYGWIRRIISAIPGTSGSGGGSGGGQTAADRAKERRLGEDLNNDGKIGAKGLLFDTDGKTRMTVGEAAGEHVAVLRMPRRMSLGATLVPDIIAGLTRAAQTNPFALPFATAPASVGPRVQMNAQTLQLVTPADRRSLSEQLEFLAPDGR